MLYHHLHLSTTSKGALCPQWGNQASVNNVINANLAELTAFNEHDQMVSTFKKE